MLLAVRIELDGKHKSAVLRTHPPHGFDGVEKMSYYGSFPVSKLGFGKLMQFLSTFSRVHVRLGLV